MNSILSALKYTMLILMIVLGGLLYSGWGSRQSWNQKVILEVETPSGLITSSTVLTYSRSKFPQRLSGSPSKRLGLFGEAPVIEITPGRYLFALSLYAPYDILGEYADKLNLKIGDIDALAEKITTNRTQIEMGNSSWPIFFYFKDLSDPSTIRQVSPDNLDSVFGKGVKLKTVKLEVTDEPRTDGVIGKLLSWSANFRGPLSPNYSGSSALDSKSGQPINFAEFNRSIVTRHYRCVIDGYYMNNLTYGLWRRGIGCGF